MIDALAFLQNIGICHRDIKPANLFLMENSEVKIIDFGESKEYLLDEDNNPATMATILDKIVENETRHEQIIDEQKQRRAQRSRRPADRTAALSFAEVCTPSRRF